MDMIPDETSISHKNQSFDRLIFVVIVILVFAMAARTPLESDVWWHLRSGQDTLASGSPVLVDDYSFTRLGQPWINHSWLAQVLLIVVFKLGGFFGLGLIVALVASGMMAMVYKQMNGSPLLKAVSIILSSVVAAWVWSPRPQIFSLLLFSLVGWILFRYKWQRRGSLWILPVIFILWSNLHAGYTLGFIMLGVYLAGEIMNKGFSRPDDAGMDWKSIRHIFLVSVVSLGAVLINPNGIETWLVPFKTVNIETLRQLIDEWSSPDFHQIALQPFLWLFFLTIIAISMSPKKVDAVDLIGIIGFAYMAFLAKRNYGPFALFCAPVLVRYLGPWINQLSNAFFEKLPESLKKFSSGSAEQGNVNPKVRQIINLCLVAMIALVGLAKLYIVTQPSLVSAYEGQYYPAGAVAYLKHNPQTGNLFNSYGWGGYLIWNLPESRVFIDGRTDLYGDDILIDWLNVIQAETGWQDIMDEWEIGVALLEPNRPITQALILMGWKTLFQDEISILLAR